MGQNGTLLYENLTFPQLCRERLGPTLPVSACGVSLEGWLLCLSMKEARAFGPYVCEAETLKRVLSTAREFWMILQAIRHGECMLDDAQHAQGFYPLCVCCQCNTDCPKFPQGDYQPQWQPALTLLENLKQNRSALNVEIKEMDVALKLACHLSGTPDWISCSVSRPRPTPTAAVMKPACTKAPSVKIWPLPTDLSSAKSATLSLRWKKSCFISVFRVCPKSCARRWWITPMKCASSSWESLPHPH